jgi:NNP family nitrate/nitrite transporter-like MFS transporter
LRAAYGKVLFVTLLFFLTFISRFIFSPLMPTIGADVGITSGQAGSLFLLAAIGVLGGSLLSGLVSARVDHRGTMILSVMVTGVTLMSCYFAHSVWFIRAAMIVLGVCAGLNQPSVTATVAATVRREDWGKALSLQQLGPRLSYAAAPFLALGLLAVFSWQTSLAVIGGIAAVSGIAFFFRGGSGGFSGTPPNLRLYGGFLRTRSFWIMVVLFALGIGAQAGLYTMIPLYLTEERGLSASAANTILGLALIPPLLTTFGAGWLTDRIGERRALLLFMVVTGLAIIALGSTSSGWMIASLFVLTAFSACFFPPAFAALSRIVQPNLRSLVAGLVPPSAFLVGGGLLPVALGYMGQAYTFSLGIVFTGVAVVAGAFLVFALRLLDVLEEGC